MKTFGKIKLGFIGCGNMAQTMIQSLLESQTLSKDQIFVSNRSAGRLKKVVDKFQVLPCQTSEELVESADLVVLAMKPQDLESALESLSSGLDSHHRIISLAAGVRLKHLRYLMPQVGTIVRVMPNTPAKIKSGVVGFAMEKADPATQSLIEDLLEPMGLVVPSEEGENFEALTVAAASGVGFVYELMIYWQEWLEEHGFEAALARQMTVKTFLGSAQLADLESRLTLDELQSQVASKKGVTAAGLESMRELEVERALRYSFEKSVLRDRKLGQS